MTRRRFRSRWTGPAAAGVVALVVVALPAAVGLAWAGYDPVAAGRALVSGAFGSWERFASITLVRATPLILTGLAVALAFRAGVWNIGAEGQLYAGAVAAVWVGLAFPSAPPWLLLPGAMAAAAVAGGLWTLVPVGLKLRAGVGEVITTILMNFVAIHMVAWLVQGPLREARGIFPQTDPIALAARLPRLGSGRLHAGLPVAVVLAGALWWALKHSAWGFRVRAVGASARAAAVSGRMRTGRVVLGAFLLSGMVAGLAGGVEVAGVTFALYENLSPGYGYTAIAVALLAGLNPLAVLLAAGFFGALQAGAAAMQRDVGVPAVWVGVIEAFVILAVVATRRLLRGGMAMGVGLPGRAVASRGGGPEEVASGSAKVASARHGRGSRSGGPASGRDEVDSGRDDAASGRNDPGAEPSEAASGRDGAAVELDASAPGSDGPRPAPAKEG